ncbi:MAG: hypothetical protein KAH30_02470 [Caldisericia bacterium]|nr:hypothetical protein [Caldisericia bacterium]
MSDMDFQGKMDKSNLLGIISFLCSIEVSGSLTLRGNLTFDIVFEEGAVIGIRSSNQETDLMSLISSIDYGSYSFSGITDNSNDQFQKLDISSDSFLHLLAKLSDESSIDDVLYDKTMFFELSDKLGAKDILLNRDEGRVIKLLTARTSIGRIMYKLNLEQTKVVKIVFSLEQAGIIRRSRNEDRVRLGVSFISKIKSFLGRFVS